jgi:hypothetical protein
MCHVLCMWHVGTGTYINLLYCTCVPLDPLLLLYYYYTTTTCTYIYIHMHMLYVCWLFATLSRTHFAHTCTYSHVFMYSPVYTYVSWPWALRTTRRCCTCVNVYRP